MKAEEVLAITRNAITWSENAQPRSREGTNTFLGSLDWTKCPENSDHRMFRLAANLLAEEFLAENFEIVGDYSIKTVYCLTDTGEEDQIEFHRPWIAW